MILKQLFLVHFRNYENARFDLHPAGNLIIAPNGYGKTNLLEAIAYCGIGKSVHFHRDEFLCEQGYDFFSIKGLFQTDNELGLEIQISWQKGKKLLKINGNPVRQLSRIYEGVKVIYSAPEDMNLIDGSPRFRRQYFDLALSQIYPEYIGLLRNYLHIVEQRNNLLKKEYTYAEKHSWDLHFCEFLFPVLQYRQKYLNLVNQALKEQYPHISEQVKDISIEYKVNGIEDYPNSIDKLIRILEELEKREKNYQRTLVGPHLDDYEFLLNQNNLKSYGSQGQKRITVIILKLIQASLIENLTSIKPIMLFDDVFAELDQLHTHRIKEFLDFHYQIFIASPNEQITSEWNELTRLSLAENKQ